MKKIAISRGDFEKQGPGIKENSVSVTAAADITRPFSLELYSEPDGKRVSSIHFPKEYRMGSVYSVELKGLDPDSCLYRLKSGRKEYTDPYVRNIKGNRKFAVVKEQKTFDRMGGYDSLSSQRESIYQRQLFRHCPSGNL